MSLGDFVLAAVVVTVGSSPGAVLVPLGIAVGVLIVQLVVVRPRLTRRSGPILAGSEAPRSRSHHIYIAFETCQGPGSLGWWYIAMLATQS